MRKQGLWKGALSLLFLSLLLLHLGSSWESLTAEHLPPDPWLHWSLRIEKTAKDLFLAVMSRIALEDIKKNLDYDSPFDQTFRLQNDREKYEVFWESKKTGMLPGPQGTVVRARIENGETIQHYEAHYTQKTFNQKEYYKTVLRFAIVKKDGAPLRRGYAEIFKDVERQITKISSSTIEGAADILPLQMIQINLQATKTADGTIFLRKDQSDPLHIPKDQDHFCRNALGTWVSRWSREWKERCDPLFDNSIWHGFSFSSIPFSYKAFVEN